jgi:hypothetical protein
MMEETGPAHAPGARARVGIVTQHSRRGLSGDEAEIEGREAQVLGGVPQC